MNVVNELVTIWRAEGIELNAGAAPEDLELLQSLLGGALSEELRELYQHVNGMVDLTYDDRQASFWSIDKIRARATDDASAPVAFADFMLDSWYFRFARGPAGLVVVSENVRPGAPPRELGSFADFLRAYIDRPTSLGLLAPPA